MKSVQLNFRLFFPILIMALCVWALFSRVPLKLVPKLKSNQLVIAKVLNQAGEVDLKSSLDTIWLPISIDDEIQNGDFIKTGDSSTVTFALTPIFKNKENKIVLAANTQVRLVVNGEKILIELKNGNLKTVLSESKAIEVKSGVTKVDFEAKKGQTEIETKKEKISTVISTPVEDDGGIDPPVREEDPNEKAKAKQEGKPDYKPKFQSYPAEDSYLLYRNARSVRIRPILSCSAKCRLKVFLKDELLLQKDMEAGKVSEQEVPFKNGQSGLVSWEVDDGSRQAGKFWLFPFSASLFQKSVSLGRHIELID